mmetsp:Transcript_22130/g.74962  ORF Transcript_22130/g.74962 Transcript_22130/m.74962 type:complete len:228 (-) Transcript_22130:87-770(-)
MDVAEVFGELIDALGRNGATQSAAECLRSRGIIHDAPCTHCREIHSKLTYKFDEISRSATSIAICHNAALPQPKPLEAVYRDAHTHAMKTCDACGTKAACAVVHKIQTLAQALVLSVAWFSTDQARDDVENLLNLVVQDVDPVLAFQEPSDERGALQQGEKLQLTAVVVFQDHHYTAFVRKGGQWRWHDRTKTTHMGDWSNVVGQCRSDRDALGPMLPYLLFYDKPS